MDHPLLMDDFDDDFIMSAKSGSEEDLFEPVKVSKEKGKLFSSRKSSEFSSGDEQESVEVNASETKKRNKSSSSPIEIKGSPARGLHRGNTDTKGSPRSASSMDSTGNGPSRLSIFKVLTRRSSNQGKHKSKFQTARLKYFSSIFLVCISVENAMLT